MILPEEGVGELSAEGVDAVGVRFAVRVGEVAEQYDGGSLVGVGYNACAGESRFSEGAGRNFYAHELGAVQFPAEGGAGVFCGGILVCGTAREGVFADHFQDARRGHTLAVCADAVI